MAKMLEVTCPDCGKVFEVEAPAAVKKPRGQLAGIALEDMTDEQLKREIINAKSVLYKAIHRDASEETIAVNQARVDAAVAEKEKRQAIKATAKAEEAATENADTEGSDEVYDESTSEEI